MNQVAGHVSELGPWSYLQHLRGQVGSTRERRSVGSGLAGGYRIGASRIHKRTQSHKTSAAPAPAKCTLQKNKSVVGELSFARTIMRSVENTTQKGSCMHRTQRRKVSEMALNTVKSDLPDSTHADTQRTSHSGMFVWQQCTRRVAQRWKGSLSHHA